MGARIAFDKWLEGDLFAAVLNITYSDGANVGSVRELTGLAGSPFEGAKMRETAIASDALRPGR